MTWGTGTPADHIYVIGGRWTPIQKVHHKEKTRNCLDWFQGETTSRTNDLYYQKARRKDTYLTIRNRTLSNRGTKPQERDKEKLFTANLKHSLSHYPHEPERPPLLRLYYIRNLSDPTRSGTKWFLDLIWRIASIKLSDRRPTRSSWLLLTFGRLCELIFDVFWYGGLLRWVQEF